MHPWHDIPLDEGTIEDSFSAVVEIPRGSRNKYELDKETGFLRLDRVLYGAVYYPANYGFIPRTLGEDGDPLDILVLALEPVHPLVRVDCRALGSLRMADEEGNDDKVIAVSCHDPAFIEYRHVDDLPGYHLREIEKFFEEYKSLEKKKVLVEGMRGPQEALRILRDAIERYRRTFSP